MVAPSVIRPLPAAKVLSPPTEVVLFRLIAWFVAVMSPLMLLVPAVCVTPPVNSSASPPLPNATLPALLNVTALVTSVLPPLSATP